MPTFSIIIPIYNAEKSICKCLDSLLAQTFSDFEVLMVDNGSTDSSASLCQGYASKDSRFIFNTFTDEKGPSGARNFGLNCAVGTYISFLDSDDYLDPDFFEVLLDAFKNSDVVFFGYHKLSVDGGLMEDYVPNVTDCKGYYETIINLYNQDLFGYTWIKAFSRSAIGEHRFPLKMKLLEDEVFTCEVLTESKRVKVIPKAIYNYVTGNSKSLIGRTYSDYCSILDKAYNSWVYLLKNYENRDEVLVKMANIHVERCMYYYFERKINKNKFLCDLSNSTFFIDNSLDDSFVKALREHSYIKLSLMRITYRFKIFIYKLLK